jgi:hypothetical protein
MEVVMATVMERQRFSLHPKREARIVVPLSRQELEQLRQRARAAGAESVASFVRAQTLQETQQ